MIKFAGVGLISKELTKNMISHLVGNISCIREAAKKDLFLVVRPLREREWG